MEKAKERGHVWAPFSMAERSNESGKENKGGFKNESQRA